MREGEELVVRAVPAAGRGRRLAAYEYDGFWMSMDTFKDRQQLEEIYARGNAPWEVWNENRVAPLTARTPERLAPCRGPLDALRSTC